MHTHTYTPCGPTSLEEKHVRHIPAGISLFILMTSQRKPNYFSLDVLRFTLSSEKKRHLRNEGRSRFYNLNKNMVERILVSNGLVGYKGKTNVTVLARAGRKVILPLEIPVAHIGKYTDSSKVSEICQTSSQGSCQKF